MASAMGCKSSYLTRLLKPGDHKIGPSLLVNLVKRVHEIATERGEDVEWLTPGWLQYGGPKHSPGRLQDDPPHYRTEPDLKLIFKHQSDDQLVSILAGVLRDAGASPEARAREGERVFREILRRLQTSSAQVSPAAETLLAEAAAGDAPDPESPRSPSTDGPSAKALPPPRDVSRGTKALPGVPKAGPE